MTLRNLLMILRYLQGANSFKKISFQLFFDDLTAYSYLSPNFFSKFLRAYSVAAMMAAGKFSSFLHNLLAG